MKNINVLQDGFSLLVFHYLFLVICYSFLNFPYIKLRQVKHPLNRQARLFCNFSGHFYLINQILQGP